MLALAGCKTIENSLSLSDVTAMKLAGVTVSFAPEAAIQWEDGIRAYATAKSIPEDQIATASSTPESKAFVQKMLSSQIKPAIEKRVASELTGTRPVRLEVVVKSFILASAVQRVVIGGGRGMIADANLVDARTGALIIAHPDMRAFLLAGQGIVGAAVQAAVDASAKESVAEKLAAQYGDIYARWLLQRT